MLSQPGRHKEPSIRISERRFHHFAARVTLLTATADVALTISRWRGGTHE